MAEPAAQVAVVVSTVVHLTVRQVDQEQRRKGTLVEMDIITLRQPIREVQ